MVAPQAAADGTSPLPGSPRCEGFSLPDTKSWGRSRIVSHLSGCLGRQRGRSPVMVVVGSWQLFSPSGVCCTGATALELSVPFAALAVFDPQSQGTAEESIQREVQSGDEALTAGLPSNLGENMAISRLFLFIAQIPHLLGPGHGSDNTLRCSGLLRCSTLQNCQVSQRER